MYMVFPKKIPLRFLVKPMVVMAVVVTLWSMDLHTAQSAVDCMSASGEAAVQACRQELRNRPGDREIRLALSDAYLSLKRYEEAVAVLQEGVEHFPGDETIKRQLILAESYLEEQRWIENQKRKQDALQSSDKADTQIRLSMIRCNKLKGEAALAACNDGLKLAPGHPGLLAGRANVWMTMERYGRAIADYQASLTAAPGNREAAKQLRLAQVKRKVQATHCLDGTGQKALDACEAALLVGAADEFSIRKQQAKLLHAAGQDKAALNAYRAASRLNPTDKQVKQALAAMTPAQISTEIKKPPEKPAAAVVSPSKKTPEQPVVEAKSVPKKIPPASTVSLSSSKTAPEMPVAPVITARKEGSNSGAITEPKPSQPVVAKRTMQSTIIPPEPPPQQPIASSAIPQRQYSNLPREPGITH